MNNHINFFKVSISSYLFLVSTVFAAWPHEDISQAVFAQVLSTLLGMIRLGKVTFTIDGFINLFFERTGIDARQLGVVRL
jgi:hypothetical protein